MPPAGSNTSHANLTLLKSALKEFSSKAIVVCASLESSGCASPLVPYIVDFKHLSAVSAWAGINPVALQHALSGIVANRVFGAFRKQHLLVNVQLSDIIGQDGSLDEGLLLCMLRLEKQRAERWLRLLSLGRAALSSDESHVVDAIGDSVMQDLLQQPSSFISWKAGTNFDLVAGTLRADVEGMVYAAMKAQAIASVMHSRLVQLVVPGWESSSTLALGLTAPANWCAWPGVVPFDKQCMERGRQTKAAAGVVGPGLAAAVFCQEVGVVQLADRVTGLPEFTAAAAAAEVPKARVLKKPRMFLAVA